ncbi:conserved hypothetical protein [Neospora caninum Liverpool]|uniref:ER membrane protein complex subunit 6 n=1 Tax=Neospora caninum (strain Liverpool) TaxID=572307 RepID=F0VDP6_NEOCL|nr:conserved hypothetical protein [Neospora caninum Liverpool]CBZ51839.1 conserved hypothetical protein [Neospora caninum Liverpool]|eukprot:XP_003881872.1 conserved hypothetical protein [Neospora caninum Liverpool]
MDTRGVEPGVQLSDLASAAQSRKAVDALTAGDDASVPERPSTPSPGLASGEKAGKKESEAPPIRPSMVSHNYRQLTVNRHLAAVVAGSVAGIFGLEGLPGKSSLHRSCRLRPLYTDQAFCDCLAFSCRYLGPQGQNSLPVNVCLFVFVLVTLLGGCLMVVETGFQCKLFFANTTDVFFAQFFTAALTFILIWTLVYNIVYIF